MTLLQRRIVIAACVAAFCAVLSFAKPVPAAHAWSWEENPYSQTGQGTAFCGTTVNFPCLLWHEPPSTSITLAVSEDPGLVSVNGYNFYPADQAGMTTWNGAPAWNPYLVSCGNKPNCGPVEIFPGPLACHTLGTTYLWWGPVFTSSQGSSAYIDPAVNPAGYGAVVAVNNQPIVLFNSKQINHEGNCSPHDPDLGDGYNTIAHELGHVMGLGESFFQSALMFPTDACLCSTLQSDDLDGIEAIYPAIPPF